jgi:serine phosphatase RsbU (regulator of sigma subunit)
MNLNKTGKWFLGTSIVFIAMLISSPFVSFLDAVPEPIKIILSFLSIILFGLSFTLMYYHAVPLKRKRVTIIISIFTALSLSLGILSKFIHAPFAGLEIIVSVLLFSSAGLPLIIRSRYESRRNLLSKRALILSFADLISIVFISVGLLGRLMHWPGANFILGLGALILLITFIGWNISFRKEVNLRHITEEKLRGTLLKVEENNKEITDSITYAKRIQTAILPSLEFIGSHLKDSFVLYQPKDIVAGDFYWAENIGDTFLIAAADCTGHGVPGAMMSVVCSNALNRSVKEFGLSEPGEILDKTRDLLIDSFSKSGEVIQDGMDISLLSMTSSTSGTVLKWAGANNPLWYIDNDGFQEIKADKQPIGESHHKQPFTTHLLSLKPGGMLYLITDGYPDQFGGPKGKKFKHKQLEALLISVYTERLEQQHQVLSDRLHQWKGDLEQVDDICVIGIRINF